MKYKLIKNIFCSLFFLVSAISFAQIQTNQQAQSQINTNENVFLDASNFNLNTNSEGKGLLFPQTDLTQWVFNVQSLDGITFPSAFDGMIVYNIGTGTTLEGQGHWYPFHLGFIIFLIQELPQLL